MSTNAADSGTLCHWHQNLGGRSQLPSGAPMSACGWVAGCIGDEAAMSALRMTALQLADGSDLSRCDDQQVLHTITAACTSGRLVTALGAGKPMLYRLVPAPAPSPPPPAPASAPRPGAAVLPPAAVQSTFEPSLDVSAMVAVLQQAANDGTPFCEECARLAARRAAQGGTA